MTSSLQHVHRPREHAVARLERSRLRVKRGNGTATAGKTSLNRQGAATQGNASLSATRVPAVRPSRAIVARVLIDEELTGSVIRCAHTVFNVLGPGLPEAVYVGALTHECDKHGLRVAREFPIAVIYDGIIVGSYRADLLIERRLIVEVKACPLHDAHRAQVLTYMKCSDVEVALLISFDPKPHVQRFVMRNGIKRIRGRS